MPEFYYDITQIPALRVPIIDPRTNLMSREWYRFFFNLYNLAGAGSNAVSLADLQVGPPDSAFSSEQLETMNLIEGLEKTPYDPTLGAEQAVLMSQLQALNLAPAYTPQKKDTRYGVFYDTTTQSAAVINTAYAVSFNSTYLSNGVYIGAPTSRIYVDRLGIYDFQFSAQLDQSSSSAHDVFIWADVNGASVADSATKITLVGNSAAAVAAWNFVLKLNAGDYFRLMWSTSAIACQITAAAAAAPVPAIPSVILTVTNNIGE